MTFWIGYPIHGADIGIDDIENGTWTNTTTGQMGSRDHNTCRAHIQRLWYGYRI